MAVSAAGGQDRPAYLQPSLVGLVVVGGTLGTATRDLLETLFGTPAGGVPWITLIINVSGAFLLGLLLEGLALAGAGRRRRAAQLMLGTGLLGGYTTYSTFVLETITLGRDESLLVGVGYAMGSVVAGFAAAFVAMGVARTLVGAVWRRQR